MTQRMQIQVTPEAHVLFEWFSAAAALAWTIIGLLIKQSLSDLKLLNEKTKLEVVQHQAQMKEELTKEQAKVREDIRVHVAEDTLRFDGITRTLGRLETTLKHHPHGD